MASTGSPVPENNASQNSASDSREVNTWLAAASDPGLTEPLALALLQQSALPAAAIEALAKNRGVASGRKVRRALMLHRHTPRTVWLPLVGNLSTLELWP